MTFIEAIAYALSRKVVLPDDYYRKMTAAQRQRAFSVAGLASLEQVKHIADQLNKVLENGGSFADFKKAVKAGDISLDLPHHRLDNIFRTNIQSAYNHGRWQQQQSNKEHRPYLMYDAVNDSRTRPSHARLDNLIRHIDDPIWERIYPPNGYRCRCNIRALTEKQMQDKGGETQDITGLHADDGWENSPRQYNQVLADKIDSWGTKVKLQTPDNIRSMELAKDRVREAIKPKEDIKIIKSWLPSTDFSYIEDAYNDFSSNLFREGMKYDLELAEVAALRYYTGDGANQLNKALYGVDTKYDHDTKLYAEVAGVLNKALDKLPNYEGVVIRRLDMSNDVLAKHEVGAVVTYYGFTSTTYNLEKDVVAQAGDNVRLVIRSKTGKMVEPFSVYGKGADKEEKEVLFGQPKKFEVLSKTEKDDYIELELEEQ